MLAIYIFSVLYFALAAPVAVREKLEVRSNAPDAFKDEIVVREKRYDSADDDSDHPFALESDARSRDPPSLQDTPYDGFNSNLDTDTNYNSDTSDDDSDDSGDEHEVNPDGDDDDDKNNENDNADADTDTNNDSEDERDNSTGYEGDYENDDERLPETPEHMTTMAYAEELLDPFMHRPRSSGSGRCGWPKRSC
jgi:hypothetical protein